MRFTIRDLVWLMVVAGLALAWWATYRAGSRAARMQRVWKENAIELGIVLGTANVEVTFDPDGFMLTKRKPPKNPPAPTGQQSAN